ncbi:hypothetical protein [Fibrobacter sp. UBA4297]|uniref:hypothetical protein n=1 Tax=Fibrobacter sp. UBA4297 TaxID=1946536 RepID=UPI0025C558EC|nr:hypothetical protein [Fibrobacter sp. UBA4297]
MKFKSRNCVSLLTALLFSASAFAASEEKLDHDNSILSVFVQPSISFISFTEREYFQDAIDTIYYGFRESAVTHAETLNVAKQDFQKVNFCFPVTAGIQWQFREDQFLSAGIGFIYDNESVVLTDRKSNTHSYEYTLQGIPLFLEYRLALPKNFITLSTGGLFSIAVRWYWTLPGTEIYTTWGKLEAENSPFGAGFGVSLGYLFASWKNFKLYGDIGFNSISVKSDKMFSAIVPNGPDEKAKWNLGGIQLQIRGSFGLWNKPKPKDDDDDDDDDGDKKPKVKIIDDVKDSVKTVQDSAKIDTSVVLDSAGIADSLKTAVQDSVGTAPENAPVPQDAPQTSAESANVKAKGD